MNARSSGDDADLRPGHEQDRVRTVGVHRPPARGRAPGATGGAGEQDPPVGHPGRRVDETHPLSAGARRTRRVASCRRPACVPVRVTRTRSGRRRATIRRTGRRDRRRADLVQVLAIRVDDEHRVLRDRVRATAVLVAVPEEHDLAPVRRPARMPARRRPSVAFRTDTRPRREVHRGEPRHRSTRPHRWRSGRRRCSGRRSRTRPAHRTGRRAASSATAARSRCRPAAAGRRPASVRNSLSSSEYSRRVPSGDQARRVWLPMPSASSS